MKKEYIINKCKKCWNIQIITDQTVCFYLEKPHKEHTSKVKLKSLIKKKEINIENNTCSLFEIINSCHQCGNQDFDGFSDNCVLSCTIHPERKAFKPENSQFQNYTEDEIAKIRENWSGYTCNDFTKGNFRPKSTVDIERDNWKGIGKHIAKYGQR